jgi:hypothetical protein
MKAKIIATLMEDISVRVAVTIKAEYSQQGL